MANKKVSAKTAGVAPTIRLAAAPLTTSAANIDVAFKLGLGHLTATLYRKMAVIARGNLTRSGRITFNDVESGDSIAIDGGCTGTAQLQIDVNTTPASPRNYPKGDIFDELDVD
jgi:hypothetical protein